jgi:hypothetical protein
LDQFGLTKTLIIRYTCSNMNVSKTSRSASKTKLQFYTLMQRVLAGLFCLSLAGFLSILNLFNPFESIILVNIFYILIWVILFVVLEFGFIFWRQSIQKYQLTPLILQLSIGTTLVVSFCVTMIVLLTQIQLLSVTTLGIILGFMGIYGYFINNFVG